MHTRVKILVVQSFEAATKNINFEVRSLDSRVLLVKNGTLFFLLLLYKKVC